MPTSRTASLLLLAGLAITARPALAQSPPLALHPENPHYFVFRGRPTILITSAEHYGAVLNLDFDYVRYLDALQAAGMNNTRTFTGAYVEPQGAFNIAKNTLAPAAEKFLAPWARSSTPGYAKGGNRFDLEKWDEAYFRRLRDFVAQAGERGIVVELNLFCPFYEELQWDLSPQNARNNVNDLGRVPRTDVYTLDKNGGLLAVHEALVRRIVAELNRFDNLYYEVCNEPYFGGVTMDWQHHIVDAIRDAERNLEHQHLVSLNIANGAQKVEQLHPGVSLINFHYATPPDTVRLNYGLNRPIGDNETGFKGTGDEHYRREGWEFILAGGALYNNLDYSFAVGHEDGSFAYPETQPGGGTVRLRRQLNVLKEFIESFDFVRMQPDDALIQNVLPQNVRVRALVEPGRQYAIYVLGGRQLDLQFELPAGKYALRWVHPADGESKSETLAHAGGLATLRSPPYAEELALRLAVEP